MLIINMFEWWYTCGWKMYFGKLRDLLRDAADFFSLGLLVGSLFAPFRQISANEVASPSLEARISVFFDKLLSRVVGATVRLFLLVIGTLLIALEAVVGVIVAVLWPLAPFAVVICLVLAVLQVGV